MKKLINNSKPPLVKKLKQFHFFKLYLTFSATYVVFTADLIFKAKIISFANTAYEL